MAGLILLAVLGAWGFICFSIAKLLTKDVEKPRTKKISLAVLLVLIFLAPVYDEIIGGFQFRALCRENADVYVSEGNLKGKQVILYGGDTPLGGYLVPITRKNWLYKDATSKDTVISWYTYSANGGWLSRTIGFPEGKPPYTFNGYCSPKNYWNIYSSLNLTVIKKD